MIEEQVRQGLEVIRMRFRHILESDAPIVLDQARAAVADTKREHDERLRQGRKEYPPQPWGYQIYPKMPLRFKATEIDKLNLRVDVFAEALWCGVDDKPYSQKLVMRIWSLDMHVVHREEWDAPRIKDCINQLCGRVMLRFHFEQASPGQQGPEHHCQVGGRAQPEEYSWFHPSISVPRLPYPPIDLILACEMIAANFFPDEYKGMRSDPTWKGALRVSQECLLRPYYCGCADVLTSSEKNSLLDELWCTKWA